VIEIPVGKYDRRLLREAELLERRRECSGIGKNASSEIEVGFDRVGLVDQADGVALSNIIYCRASRFVIWEELEIQC